MHSESCIKDLSQLAATPGHEREAYEALRKLTDRSLTRLHNDIGWIVWRYLRASGATTSPREFAEALSEYLALDTIRPSRLHSLMLRQAVGLARRCPDYDFYSFFMQWGPEHLTQEDCTATDSDGDEASGRPTLAWLAVRCAVAGMKCPGLPAITSRLNGTPLDPEQVWEAARSEIFWSAEHALRAGDTERLRRLFSYYATVLCGAYPGRRHSRMLGLACRALRGSLAPMMIPFLKAWDPALLTPDDLLPRSGEEGEEYVSLESLALRSAFDSVRADWRALGEAAPWLLPLMTAAVENGRADSWLRRDYALTLARVGRRTEAHAVLLALAGKMCGQSYYWSDLASITDDPMLRCALLARSLLMRAGDRRFTGSTHLEMARAMIDASMPGRAAVELLLYRRRREAVRKPLSKLYDRLAATVGVATDLPADQRDTYTRMARRAEEHVFSAIPSVAMTVTGIWRQADGTSLVSLSDASLHSVTVRHDDWSALADAVPGMSADVRLAETDGAYRAVAISRADRPAWSDLPEETGTVTFVSPRGTAFVQLDGSGRSVTVFGHGAGMDRGVRVAIRPYTGRIRGEETLVAATVRPL